MAKKGSVKTSRKTKGKPKTKRVRKPKHEPLVREPVPSVTVDIGDAKARAVRECNEFLHDVRFTNQPVRVTRARYCDTFGVERAPLGVDAKLLENAIAYELLVRGYKKVALPIPDKVRVNHKAALKFDVSNHAPGMKNLLGALVDAHPTNGDDEMARKGVKTKKAKGRKRSTGTRGSPGYTGRSGTTGVIAFVTELFDANGKKRLTDEQLSKAVKREFPDTKRDWNVACIRLHRSLYNNGRLPAQDGNEPRKPLVPFDDAGDELPMRYRSEESAAPAPRKTKKVGGKKKSKGASKKTPGRKVRSKKGAVRRKRQVSSRESA